MTSQEDVTLSPNIWINHQPLGAVWFNYILEGLWTDGSVPVYNRIPLHKNVNLFDISLTILR